MEKFLNELSKLAKDKHNENKKFFTKLKKKPPKKLDYIMQELHEAEFDRIDCMSCGNCCKTTSPIFTEKDMERIAKHLRMKQHDFMSQYIQVDEDNFYVLKEAPCAFLDHDNACSIYDVRPKACKEYPHTNRRKFEKISKLTMENIAICPATYNIVEALKARVDLEHKTNKRA